MKHTDSELLDWVFANCEIWTNTENHTSRSKIENREDVVNEMNGDE